MVDDRREARCSIEGVELWKRACVQALFDVLAPSGCVAQIGFGTAGTADHIALKNPQQHLLFEEDPGMYKRAVLWAKDHPGATVQRGSYEEFLKEFGPFHAIFIDETSPENDALLAARLSEEALPVDSGNTMKELHSQFSSCKALFSDAQIEEFYQEKGRHQKEELALFFKRLEENGNITKEQYRRFMKKYEMEEMRRTLPSDPFVIRINTCCQHCLPGGRISFFCLDQRSKYDDAQFFDAIITNTSLLYREEKKKIDVLGKTYTVIIPLIQKL